MCGIVGCSGLFSGDGLEASLQLIAHRGPDDQGIWVSRENGVALGHRRLSIIDVSAAGHQPMTDASGRYTIVYNGEIYNFRELRAELEAQGARFRGHSDTEVLLEMFARRGRNSLRELNGIFALAIWDEQRRELLLARDALGVKPLYIAQQSHGVAFASELKALLPFLKQRSLDHAALHRYLSFLWCPGDGTPLREAKKVLPGEALTIVDGKIKNRWVWYELPARRGTTAPLSAGEVVAATESALRTAVHRQMVSDVPVGAFLSGGLDSSAVAAFARERVGDLRCFTISNEGGNDAGFVDDLPYARKVARHLNLPLEVVSVDARKMAADVEQMIWLLDEPLADPASLNVLYISQLARGNGIKVLLSGTAGDDLFSGYRRHRALALDKLWDWLPATARNSLSSIAGLLNASTSLGRRAQRLFSNISGDAQQRLTGYFAWIPESRLRGLYSASFTAELGAQRADQPMLDFLSGVPATALSLDKMLALEQRFFLADHNLTYTDRMSMAAGVEVRVPFLDLDLVELAARIPSQFKQRGRVGKWVLKKAMEPLLPHDVIYRPKTGFGSPLRRWLRHDLRELVDDATSPDVLRRRGIFDPDSVAALRAADEAGRIDAAYPIFSAVCIEWWCRRFVDSPTLT